MSSLRKQRIFKINKEADNYVSIVIEEYNGIILYISNDFYDANTNEVVNVFYPVNHKTNEVISLSLLDDLQLKVSMKFPKPGYISFSDLIFDTSKINLFEAKYIAYHDDEVYVAKKLKSIKKALNDNCPCGPYRFKIIEVS